MAFDFLRKKKKYPRNQAAEPSGPAPDREMEAAQSARMAKLAKRLQAESETRPVRVYAGPPRRDPTANLVYAGPPPRDPPADPVYAGPPPRDPPAPVYAGPPPRDPPAPVYAGPPADRGPQAVRVYAGPPPRGPQPREQVNNRIYAGPPRGTERSGEDEPDRRPPLEVYAGPPFERDDDIDRATAVEIYAGPEDM